jgi:hypothetical protein
MAIISSADFEKILEEHGEDAYLVQIEEAPSEDQAETSPFDMIYGFADSDGEAGSGSTEKKRPFRCLIQEVQTGQEAWVSKVGTLEVGDAVMFCEVSYSDDDGDFVIKSSDIIESPNRDNARYEVEKPAHNLDGNQNIFFQVILRKLQT